jgi:methyl-accepting chemotaxis protein
MSIKLKLIALFLAPLIAFLGTAIINIYQNTTAAKEAEQVSSLVKLVVSLNDASDAMQKERAFSVLFALRNELWRDELDQQRAITDNKEKQLLHLITQTDTSGFSEATQTAINEKMTTIVGGFKTHRTDIDNLVFSPDEITGKLSRNIFDTVWLGLSLVHESKTPTTLLDIINYTNVVKLKNAMGTLHSVLPISLIDGKLSSMKHLVRISKLESQMRSHGANIMQLSKGELNKTFMRLHKETLHGNKQKRPFYKELSAITMKGIDNPLNVELNQWLGKMDDLLSTIRTIEANAAKEVINTANSEQELAQNNLIFWISLVLIVLLITTITSIYLMKGINKPLANMTSRLQDIAEGEGDLTKQLENLPKDELGTLGGWVNTIIENLRLLIIEIQSTATAVNDSAEKTIHVAHSNNDAVNLQLSEINMVVTAMNEMAVTSQQMAESASTAADSANEGQNYVDICNSKVSENCQAIEEMVEQISDASHQVSDLEMNTKQIHTILSTIQNIAEQTNLLALNAAIEAARAGDQGRGFAVVADEVRTLAKRTQDSTSEISAMLDQLQTSTNGVVSAMNQTQDKSTEGLEKAKDAVNALTKVEQSVTMISDMNIQIATATEEQSCVCEEMNRNMVQIQTQSDVVQEQSKQASDLGEQLGNVAKSQRELVSQFTT